MHRPPTIYEDNGIRAGRVLLLFDPDCLTACTSRETGLLETSSAAVPFFADLMDRFDIAFWSHYTIERLSQHVEEIKNGLMAHYNKAFIPLFITSKKDGGLEEIWMKYPIYGPSNTICVANDLHVKDEALYAASPDNFLHVQRLQPFFYAATIIKTLQYGDERYSDDRLLKVLYYLNEVQRSLAYATIGVEGGAADIRDILSAFCSNAPYNDTEK